MELGGAAEGGLAEKEGGVVDEEDGTAEKVGGDSSTLKQRFCNLPDQNEKKIYRTLGPK